MKLVYTNENRMLTGNAKNLLELAGIEVQVKNEFAAGAVGDLAAFDTWPEIWVINDSDYAQAVTIIAQALSPQNAPDWHCPNCQEQNDAAFELCWKCQQPRAEQA